MPRILGELIFLLEYRGASVILPYSGDEFSIPDNVYILGTMNTADRSIAMLDHALRRRFDFVPMKPDPEVLRAFAENCCPDFAWLADLLEVLNRQLTQDGIDWHLHCGHSHFMKEQMDEKRLRRIWKFTIMPMLDEYFYQNRARLQAYELDRLRDAL